MSEDRLKRISKHISEKILKNIIKEYQKISLKNIKIISNQSTKLNIIIYISKKQLYIYSYLI